MMEGCENRNRAVKSVCVCGENFTKATWFCRRVRELRKVTARRARDEREREQVRGRSLHSSTCREVAWREEAELVMVKIRLTLWMDGWMSLVVVWWLPLGEASGTAGLIFHAFLSGPVWWTWSLSRIRRHVPAVCPNMHWENSHGSGSQLVYSGSGST